MKEPAFSFYPDNFLGGTALMTDEQAGIYIKMLCTQHLHGHFTDPQFERLSKGHDEIKKKFIKDENNLWYNERLQHEIDKKEAWSKSQTEKINKRWDKYRGIYRGNTGDHTGTYTGTYTGAIPSVSVSVSVPIKKKDHQPDKPVDPRFKEIIKTFGDLWEKNRGFKYADIRKDVRELKAFLEDNPEITTPEFFDVVTICANDTFEAKNLSIRYVCSRYSVLRAKKQCTLV